MLVVIWIAIKRSDLTVHFVVRCFEIREGRMGKCRGERVKTRTCGGMCSGERGMECILL